MSDNFFKVKNGLNLPTLILNPTVTPPANSAAGDMAFYNGKLYIYDGTAWGIKPGSSATGLITNVDVSSTVGDRISGNKITPDFGSQNVVTTGAVQSASAKVSGLSTGVVHADASGNLSSSVIVNADVSSAAGDRIAGSKITPDFGSQNITTTGSVTANSAKVSSFSSAGVVHNDASGNLSTSSIVNADVSAIAAIDGSKINPDFGSQNVATLGNLTVNGPTSKLSVDVNSSSAAVEIRQLGSGNALTVIDDNTGGTDSSVTIIDQNGNVGIGVAANASLSNKLEVLGNTLVTGTAKVVSGNITLDSAKGIESHNLGSTLNIGTTNGTDIVNIGTGSNTQTINIGTGLGTTTINIGATNDNVVVAGTLTTVNTTNLDVADKNITLNKGGAAGSANGSGINIEANSVVQASLTYAQTDGSAQPQDAFTFSGTGAVAVSSGTTAQRPNTPANGMIRYNSTLTAFEGYAANTWSAIGGGGTIDKVTQNSHGFSVGHLLYLNGSTYAKAQADTAATAEVVGMVSRVVDANNFELTLNGEVSGLTGLTAGGVYFLDATTAGLATLTEPSVVGQISVPIGVASNAAGTTMYVMPKRGVVVGSANARTKIYLANNATTNVQSVSAYEAGGLAGWVFLDGTTDYRFYIQAQFALNAAGTDYNLSYQTTGDTPPAGFSMAISAAGMIQAVVPSGSYNPATSFIQYALNAPAVGATLPLAIDSSLVQFSSVQAKDVNGISVKNAAGSTTNVFVSDAGNVGIGTSSPNTKLHVATSAVAAVSAFALA